MAEPRELTLEECRDRFLQHVRLMIRYWTDLPAEQIPPGENETHWRVSGVAFSILTALDGAAMGLPGWIVAPAPHADDREFHKEEGENWWPENDATAVKADIAGELHDLLKA